MKIKKITIKNFHCYKEAEFELAPGVTVLIGKNGSGKSSLVKAIKNCLSIFFSDPQKGEYPTLVGNVSDLSVSNLSTREFWHDDNMKPADAVELHMEVDGDMPSWSYYKECKQRSRLQTGYFKDAYTYFREHYGDDDTWPLFVYYSDYYPHIEAQLSEQIKRMIYNDDRLYRAWAYYHWDREAACALIWQKRYVRIYNLMYKRTMSLTRMKEGSEEARRCQEDINRYQHEIDFVVNSLKRFTCNDEDHLSDSAPSLEISDLIVDGDEKDSYLVVYFSDGTRRRWDELPAGYERLYNIVFDIAYRSLILNGSQNEPEGIVLVDEVDLHLHPSMEQNVLQRLTSTFPNIQFVVSTHSPLVIANTFMGDKGKILLLQHDDEIYEHTPIADPYGLDYNFVLSAIMKTEPQNLRLEELKNRYYRLMRRGKHDLAQQALGAIKELVSEERFKDLVKELKGKI